MTMETITMGFVGDLLVEREDPSEPFIAARDLLSSPDILFGNLEAAFSDHPHPAPSGGTPLFPRAHNLDVFSRVGFDILSLANNHTVDAGHEVLLENISRLHSQGVRTCGAGATLAEARKAAQCNVKGRTVSVLAYASVFPMGYEARSNVPGVNPLRSYDFYQPPFDNYHLPGTPYKVTSVFDERDVELFRADMEAARKSSDILVASFHWGDFLRPYVITQHEKRLARMAIDLGADVVVGHHHHTLRGVEWYKGKPILYGVGHFVFDLKLDLSEEARSMFASMPGVSDSYQIAPRDGWPYLPMHPDGRMTAYFEVSFDGSGEADVGIMPCELMPNGYVNPVDALSVRGQEILEYLRLCNTSQGLADLFTTQDGRKFDGKTGITVRKVAQ